MKRITQTLFLLALTLSGLITFARAQENLIPNADFSDGNGKQVNNWEFSTWIVNDNPLIKGKVDGSVNTDTDGHRYLSVTSSESIHAAQMWWQTHPIICSPGATYNLSVMTKGTLTSGSAHMVVALFFMDQAGKWLNLQEIAPVPDLSDAWQKVEGSITLPENAEKVGVRLGLVFSDGQATVFFKDPALVLKTN